MALRPGKFTQNGEDSGREVEENDYDDDDSDDDGDDDDGVDNDDHDDDGDDDTDCGIEGVEKVCWRARDYLYRRHPHFLIPPRPAVPKYSTISSDAL